MPTTNNQTKGRQATTPRKLRRKGKKWPTSLYLSRFLLFLILPVLLALIAYLTYLDKQMRGQFEGKRWALPAQVYARPLELYAGMTLDPDEFEESLRRLRYRLARSTTQSGTYGRDGNRFHIRSRSFFFWDGAQQGQWIKLQFHQGRLQSLTSLVDQQALGVLRLEPEIIARIYPLHKEDRILVRLSEVPSTLVNTLLAVEDRSFHSHFGVDFRGILRAILANIRAGGLVQGGSTLTQQLVKNFFLTSERTLKRKINEAIMALLLEARYSKDEILEAYLNEIYFGQDGPRSIHGIGLASQFYFSRPLNELEAQHMALLVAIIKGPSYYNPRRHADRARQRRNQILGAMSERNLLPPAHLATLKATSLGLSQDATAGISSYPAFMDLVRRQLRRDYQEQDLRSEGLRIFTTLAPEVQTQVESIVSKKLQSLEKIHKLPPKELESALVLSGTQNGEIIALIGGRTAGFPGFNRALDAVRPIGSLVKPAVYLNALSKPNRYTVISTLDDRPLRLKDQKDHIWAPKNYDRRYHQDVPLHTALAKSYNLATVRLGLDLGVEEVIHTLTQLGVRRTLQPYPSLFLGACALSPIEVTQMYQTLAGGGFRTPLRAIREVLDVDGRPLQRYPLTVKQTVKPESVYLINTLLKEVVDQGTARSVKRLLPTGLEVAGKTGTTNDTRDSWFAGFSQDILGVVWIGRDDNHSMRLTGSSGALQVWGEVMRKIHPRSLQMVKPKDVEIITIDPSSGLRVSAGCPGKSYPFIRGSAPGWQANCRKRVVKQTIPAREQPKKSPAWWQKVFQ